ncbi:Membrane bound O-acyl transferase family domain containing protein [Tylopilus felleus]
MNWRSDILQHAVVFERAVVTPHTFATTFLPAYFSYYAMAVLVQLPHTRLYRAALLPVVLWTTFRANMSLDFSWNPAYMNQGLALGMFIISMRSTAWVLAKQPFTRFPIPKSENGTINDHNANTPTEHGVSVASALWNACDLTANFRNIGWIGLQKIHVPTPYLRVESRSIFVLLSLCRLTFFAVTFDILCRYIRSFGRDTFGTPKGGTIFDPALPAVERYTKSSIITLLYGLTAYLLVDATYQLLAVLFVVLFRQYPSQWPPLFDVPWLATSLSSFWGRRWHQLFREPFVVIGSKPMERFGRVGTIMGAFALSSVLHDVGTQGMGRDTDDTLPVVGFFLIHGVGVLMEDAWKQATGKRVGGIIGWLWVISWLVLWGQLVVDAWARRGLLGPEFCPEAYRPSTLFLNWLRSR